MAAESKDILIVGASARAAAKQAAALGYRVWAADLFEDADLTAIAAETRKVLDYPHGFAPACATLPPAPWMFTGGLENHPDVVDTISRNRPLLGNPGAVLKQVRDPLQLSAVFRDAGIPFPETRLSPPTDPGANWLRKPFTSCAGRSIRPATASAGTAGRHFFQRFVLGQLLGAAYTASNGKAMLIGVTRQLVGQTWCGVEGFQYCGSLGPLSLSAHEEQQFQHIGTVLARHFGLRGLFGVDVIRDHDATIWPIEVNPRYTASMELYCDNVLTFHLAGWHLADLPDTVAPQAGWRGKAIVFATHDIDAMPDLRELSEIDGTSLLLADIPATGTRIASGQPVVSVFAEGQDENDVDRKLRKNVAAMYSLLANARG